MKRLAVLVLVLFALTGCTLPGSNGGTLTLSVPESAYPPCEVLIVAGGVTGGQFTFSVEGKTYTQTGNSLPVTVNELPCEVTVTWEGNGGPLVETATIYLKNKGPIPGRPMLNGISNLWVIHPRSRYTVTFPDACDNEGGPVTLIDVTIFHTTQSQSNTVFCPPYTGMNPPKPDLYRVRTGQGDIDNAFVFYSIWNGFINDAIYLYPEWDGLMKYTVGDKVRVKKGGNWIAYECKTVSPKGVKPGVTVGWEKRWKELGPAQVVDTVLPYSPPSQQESGYPGAPASCGPQWPREFIPAGITIITSTWEDEQGARTIQIDEIPTMEHPACD